jgi:hypothetical protein
MKCLVTGNAVRNGDIFSSPVAAEAFKAQDERMAQELKDEGFTRVADTPNLFMKDGRGVTLEAYRNEPVATLARHKELAGR